MVICGAYLLIDERGVIIGYKFADQFTRVRKKENVLFVGLLTHSLADCTQDTYYMYGSDLCQCRYIHAIAPVKQI